MPDSSAFYPEMFVQKNHVLALDKPITFEAVVTLVSGDLSLPIVGKTHKGDNSNTVPLQDVIQSHPNRKLGKKIFATNASH